MTHRAGDGLPPGFVFGELPPTEKSVLIQPPFQDLNNVNAEKIWADMQLAEAQLYTDVAVAEGDFHYQPPVYREVNFKKRHPREWFNTELPPMEAAFKYLREAHGRVYMDEAITMVERVARLLYERRPDGARSTLFEAPLDRWAQGDNVARMVSDFRDVYQAKGEGHLRDDDDLYGTSDRLAYCDGRPFVLTERTRVAKDSAGARVITRLVEATRIESAETVMNAANRLSLRERLRVKHLLAEWGAEDDHYVRVNKLVDRRAVQSDADVKRLLDGCRVKESGRQRAVRILREFAASAIHPSIQKDAGSANIAQSANSQGRGSHRRPGGLSGGGT